MPDPIQTTSDFPKHFYLKDSSVIRQFWKDGPLQRPDQLNGRTSYRSACFHSELSLRVCLIKYSLEVWGETQLTGMSTVFCFETNFTSYLFAFAFDGCLLSSRLW